MRTVLKINLVGLCDSHCMLGTGNHVRPGYVINCVIRRLSSPFPSKPENRMGDDLEGPPAVENLPQSVNSLSLKERTTEL